MIYWSHFKCMTTEPGVLPRNYSSLDLKKMTPEMAKAIIGVKKEIKTLEQNYQGEDLELKEIEKRIREHIDTMDEISEE